MISMYNMICSQKLGHGDGCCPLCPGFEETNEHILFHCFKAQCGWAAIALFYEADTLNSSLTEAHSIMDIIDGCLEKTPLDTVRLFVVYHTSWELWDQHNDWMYNQKHPTFFAKKIAELAKERINVVARYSMSYKKWRRLKSAEEFIPPFRPALGMLQEDS